MGSFANSLFKIMLGWLQTAVSAVWSAFTSENGSSFFSWIGQHWILLAGILCVIGLATDLCVYFCRWQPYKVWKSFFTGYKETDEHYPGRTESAGNPKINEEGLSPKAGYTVEPDARGRIKNADETDLSRWEAECAEKTTQKAGRPEEKTDMVTNAGYIVPADSPYRKPAQKKNLTDDTKNEYDYSSKKGRMNPAPIAPRRRRKINVSELFTDPEEELHRFDAPQQVIDSRKAYRNPVYPSGWKKNEDSEE